MNLFIYQAKQQSPHQIWVFQQTFFPMKQPIPKAMIIPRTIKTMYPAPKPPLMHSKLSSSQTRPALQPHSPVGSMLLNRV